MATFGSKKFEDQLIRAHIKDRLCKVGDECSIAIHPPKIPGRQEHHTCPTCIAHFEERRKDAKEEMEYAQQLKVQALIKASCPLGVCSK